jgi:hypothetical protein
MYLRDVPLGARRGLDSLGWQPAATPDRKERPMKNPLDVLRMKEEEIQRVKKEIEALQITARLLSESEESRDKKSEYRQLLQMP